MIVFVLVRLAPGDPTQTLLGPNASETTREALRSQLGLNDPLYVQYAKWLWLVLQGDLGKSIEMHTPVTGLVRERFGSTLILGLSSGALGLLVGVVAGVASALLKDGVFDRFTLYACMLGVSLPGYWLSIVLIYVFAVRLGWFPTGQMYDAGGERTISDLLYHLVLPAAAAVVVPAALVTRFTRTSVLEFVGLDFVTGLKSRGLSEWRGPPSRPPQCDTRRSSECPPFSSPIRSLARCFSSRSFLVGPESAFRSSAPSHRATFRSSPGSSCSRASCSSSSIFSRK